MIERIERMGARPNAETALPEVEEVVESVNHALTTILRDYDWVSGHTSFFIHIGGVPSGIYDLRRTPWNHCAARPVRCTWRGQEG